MVMVKTTQKGTTVALTTPVAQPSHSAADGPGHNERHVEAHKVLSCELAFEVALLSRLHRVTIYGT